MSEGQRHSKAYESIICDACKNSFMPCNYQQRICSLCAPNKKAVLRALRYKISEEQTNKILEEQEGHCALCPKPGKFIDHDHRTGKVRGILCPGCNSALNRVEIEGWVEKAHDYLKKYA